MGLAPVARNTILIDQSLEFLENEQIHSIALPGIRLCCSVALREFRCEPFLKFRLSQQSSSEFTEVDEQKVPSQLAVDTRMQRSAIHRLRSLPDKRASFVEPMECLSVTRLPEGSQWLSLDHQLQP